MQRALELLKRGMKCQLIVSHIRRNSVITQKSKLLRVSLAEMKYLLTCLMLNVLMAAHLGALRLGDCAQL